MTIKSIFLRYILVHLIIHSLIRLVFSLLPQNFTLVYEEGRCYIYCLFFYYCRYIVHYAMQLFKSFLHCFFIIVDLWPNVLLNLRSRHLQINICVQPRQTLEQYILDMPFRLEMGSAKDNCQSSMECRKSETSLPQSTNMSAS